MELELKHLAPYLPYGLKGIDYDKKTYYFIGLDNVGNIHWDCNEVLNKKCYDVKPILRPLSDLKKEEFNYLYTLLRVHIGKNKRDNLINEGYGITDLPYFIFEQLLENHFDLFNLIKDELAIDINIL